MKACGCRIETICGAKITRSSIGRTTVLPFLVLLILLLNPVGFLAAQELLLFGGENQDQYLGCLTCPSVDPSSVWSRFGDFGNRFSSKSIWNRFGEYGSKFSDLRPWNMYASNPPVIVDREGNYYGCLTANRFHPEITQIEALLKLTEDPDWVFDHLDELRDQF